MASADVVIRGGTIVDGTGAPAFVGDIAITGGIVSEVGESLAVAGLEEIDATGLVVAPGFCDIHSHFDAQCTWDPLLSPSAAAGVTTVIGGNCGVGFAPARRDMHEFITQLMEGVEDIPAAALNEGLSWNWETFPEYLDELDRCQFACDIGMFIAHGPVRAYVLGERCNDSDKPGGPFKYPVTDEEIEQMSEVVRDAVAAGALGFSTNRLGGHRDGQGVCVPGTLGSAYEYTQLCKGAALGGGGVAQFVSDFASYDDIPRGEMDPEKQAMRSQQDREILEFVTVEYGLKVLMSAGLPNDKEACASMIPGLAERMRTIEARGGSMSCQTFARPQALLTSWDCRSNYFAHTPTYKGLNDSMGRGSVELKQSLMDPQVREIVLSELDDILAGNTRLSVVIKSQWNQNNLAWHFVMDEDFDYEPGPEKSVVAIAEASGRTVFEVLYDTMCTFEGNGMTWRPLESYGGGDLESMREFLETDGAGNAPLETLFIPKAIRLPSQARDKRSNWEQ